MLFWKKETRFNRIKKKLEEAKRKDAGLVVFGASSHQYKVHEKLAKKELADWQAKHQIKLPEPYAQLLTKVGNGGAGPYYGLYPLEKATAYTDEHALAAKCVLYPEMSKEEWNHLVGALIHDEDIPDTEYDDARNRVLGGMLCIGTQGCEYDMYLVLDGVHKGKIVYTSEVYADHPFFFVYEDSILDWYERWLDEIILDYDIWWFGNQMPGDEHALIQVYQNDPNEETQLKALQAMFKFKKISQPTMKFLKHVVEHSSKHRITAIRLICKTSLKAGRGDLLKLLQSERDEDFMHALGILHGHSKSVYLAECIQVVVQSLGRVQDPEMLRHAGYVLDAADAAAFHNFAPFLCHDDPKMQEAAIYATRNCKDKPANWEVIDQLLAGSSKDVMKYTILYWGIIPHEKLLPYYKDAWPDYKDNPNFREKFEAGLRELQLPDDYFDRE